MLGSPVYARLAGQLSVDPSPVGAILGDDASWDLGLRLFSGVHNLVLEGLAPDALSGSWEAFVSALHGSRDELRRWVAVPRLPLAGTA